MTDHDPLCPQHLQYPGHRSRCICVLLREADARARADERADLRAKVEWMRNEALEGFRSQPHRSHLGTMASTLERVLALIEEAERG